VPFHPGRDISPSLLRKIAADVKLTVDEFLAPR
jgi:predicted RNA binding protein YcfA (HicA-like mRNA interferase family)